MNEDYTVHRLHGDCMEPEMNDQDIVVIKRQKLAQTGDVIAFTLAGDEQVYLKRLYWENGLMRLQPSNPDYEAIQVDPRSIKILGKAVVCLHLGDENIPSAR